MQSEQQDSILQGHLPECPTTTDPHGLDDGYACPCECQCEILRACEERVRQEIDRESFALDEGDPFREAYRTGYSKGVRDAHESASWCQDSDEMLQAIIGLLNMPPPPPLPPSVGVPEKWRP